MLPVRYCAACNGDAFRSNEVELAAASSANTLLLSRHTSPVFTCDCSLFNFCQWQILEMLCVKPDCLTRRLHIDQDSIMRAAIKP